MVGIPLYNLPDGQRQVMHFIVREINDSGQSPTVAEISAACEMTPQHVNSILNNLEKRGRIKRVKHTSRSITIVQ
jgi:SOS-response transcriptional repressor LexA